VPMRITSLQLNRKRRWILE